MVHDAVLVQGFEYTDGGGNFAPTDDDLDEEASQYSTAPQTHPSRL